jgi:hypothetical protein
MNSAEKPWRWGKRKEERKPNRFLERNDEDRRRRAVIFLLFLSHFSPFFPRQKEVVAHRGATA